MTTPTGAAPYSPLPVVQVNTDFRFRLERRFDALDLRSATRPLVFVMLNPSTADDRVDDPTIRKCIGFAKRLGYSGISVVNLFPYRATKPRDLHAWVGGLRPIMLERLLTENDEHVVEACRCAHVVLAWGGNADHYADRVAAVRKLVASVAQKVMCLGRTRRGTERHPLMLSYLTEVESVARVP